MATQAGLTNAQVNAPYTLVHDLPRAKPGPKQVLVKSLATSLNPVDPWMQHTGMLVMSWPAIFGCDAGGIVLEAGPGCTKLKVGHRVFGCTRVGQSQYSTFQETFLMDEDLTYQVPKGVSVEAASTMGVGLDTAGLGLIAGAGFELPAAGTEAAPKNEWVIVLGSTGTVGQYVVRIAHLAGYKVLAAASPSKASIATKQGADATFNNRASVEEQLAEIKKITDGKFSCIYDASGAGAELAIKALQTVSTTTKKFFATVDDFTDAKFPDSIDTYRISLGAMGRTNAQHPTGDHVTQAIAAFIPKLQALLDSGAIKPLDYEVVDGVGWDSVLKGMELLEAGKAKNGKLVVRIQEE